MNALVPTPQYHAQLPAFLRDPALFASSDSAIAGIGGGAPPMISIRQSRFRLVGSDGEEQVVDQTFLNVIVLEGNPHVSKMYYAEAYNPADSDAKPPTCWSDNGQAPSSEAASPQSATCATCQWGAWGSKVTPSGSKVKACSDAKKLAVVLATDTNVVVNGAATAAKAYEQIFLLRVPAASMVNWKTYGKSVLDRGVPLQGVVTQVSFDAEANYPALLFKASAFVQDEATFRYLMEQRGTSDVRTAIGADDHPRAIQPALAAPAPSFMAPEAPAALAPLAPVPAVAPVAPLPPRSAAAPIPAAPAPQAARQRGRPPRAPDALSSPGPAAMAPPPMQAAPTPAATNGVIVQPQMSDASLDELLRKSLDT